MDRYVWMALQALGWQLLPGALSCFDRVLYRGYLPLESGWAMADFLRSQGCSGMC